MLRKRKGLEPFVQQVKSLPVLEKEILTKIQKNIEIKFKTQGNTVCKNVT